MDGSMMIGRLEPAPTSGTSHGGATFRVRGRGMTDVVSGRSRGDLFVTVRVVTPKKLSKDQKKILEQFAATLPKEEYEPTPRDQHDERGLFDKVKDIFG